MSHLADQARREKWTGCFAFVSDGRISYRCMRKVVKVTRDGLRCCWQHDPAYVKKMSDARHAVWKKKYDAKNRHWENEKKLSDLTLKLLDAAVMWHTVEEADIAGINESIDRLERATERYMAFKEKLKKQASK